MAIVIGILRSPEAQTGEPPPPAAVRAQLAAARAEVAAAQAQVTAARAAAQAEARTQVQAGGGSGVTVTTSSGREIIQVPPRQGPFEYIPVQRLPANNDIPPRIQETLFGMMFTLAFIVVAFPIARAVARWLDRKRVPAPIPAELTSQLSRMETVMEAMQIEVERIAESQRFMAKIANEQRDPLAIGRGDPSGARR